MQTQEAFWENPLLPFSASQRQLQLLQVKYAKYEPTAMSSSENAQSDQITIIPKTMRRV